MEQVQLVQDSHTIAGIHGNAQAACWFSPRGATLIDIQPHATSLPGRAPEDHPQFITSWLRVISDEIGLLLLPWRASKEHVRGGGSNRFGQTEEDTYVLS
jgi:hypothetical protein